VKRRSGQTHEKAAIVMMSMMRCGCYELRCLLASTGIQHELTQ